MMQFLQTVKKFMVDHKKAVIVTSSIVGGGILLTLLIVFIVMATAQKIIYQPVAACTIFTPAEAKQLLGDTIYNPNNSQPDIQKNSAYSSCGYSDLNADENSMKVAAISVRSAINDAGVADNKTNFKTGEPAGSQDVSGIGEAAYFNPNLGQLNVLTDNGKRWIVLSYGVGTTPAANTLDDAKKLATLVLN